MRWKSHIPLLFLFTWLCLAGGGPSVSWALTIKRPQLKDMVAQASIIVQAKVSKNQSVKGVHGIPMIQTLFQTIRVIKGPKVTAVAIELVGGSTGKYKLLLPDIPRFAVGAEAILFLRPQKGRKRLLLVGFYYGVFDIKDKKGQKFVSSRGQLIKPQPLSAFVSSLKKMLSPHVPLSSPKIRSQKK